MSTRKPKALLTGLLAVGVIGSTLALVRRSDDYAFFDPLIDVKAIIDRTYVSQVNQSQLQQAAIVGMIEDLDDPYTMYVPPVHAGEFAKELSGEYVGIGAEISMIDGVLTIMNPMEDSPALDAGLRPDDRVIAIEGDPTRGKTADECVTILQGQPGTPVRLTIDRAGQTLDITVIRAHIKTRDVKGFHRDPGDEGAWRYLIDPDNKVAYVRVARFTGEITRQVQAGLDSARAQAGGSLNGLILDLRDNPGGRLDEAIALADLFLSEGRIVSTKGLHHEETVADARRGQPYETEPMIVLVNGLSASASEVVSGALADNNRALIIGTRTFGKGSVQGVHNIPSQPGAVIKITEQYYYLPSGRCLHRTPDSPVWGVDPSPGFFVPLDDDQRIEMLRARRAQEILRLDTPESADDHWSDPQWIVQTLRDPQLAKALEALQVRHATGQWPPAPEGVDVQHQVQADELSRANLQRERVMRELERITRIIDTLEQGQAIATPRDLWPDDTKLTGGTITIRDKDGNPVAELKITGETLERWLIDADVEPVSP
ncbi:MAG: S41 family peptidase [Leptolyngbya sp. PLA3]|nr:MAG: S41 family peptidase [Cyanobacteria bacterium CYA]MCE7969113.1 S41 family peptidase [Leptolyngbya sp. PL-A3]